MEIVMQTKKVIDKTDLKAGRESPGMKGPTRKPYHRRIIIKFQDYVRLPYERTAEKYIEEMGIGPWRQLAEEYKGIKLYPLFISKKPEEIQSLVERGREMDPTYKPPNFLTYFVIELPPGTDAESITKILSGWSSVAIAYIEPPPVEPPVNAADDPRSGNQGYLDPSPDGIDAEYAWGFSGGDGAGQALVDLEWGWTLNHEDLAAHGITIISGLNYGWFFHGTAVLGEVAACDNTVGCIGIASAISSIRCVGQWLSSGGYSTSQPILDAIAIMQFGDVLLLEAQTSLWGYSLVPVEIEPAVFDVIRLATALGIVVVEAAGNGGVDLDTVVNPGGQHIFDRGSADFQDSGAIIVGAASSTDPHSRLTFSCHGSRVDCYGWGENIDSLSSDSTNTATDLYTTNFGGTSGASPIVTGAAILVQGLAEANLGYRFGPWHLRTILSDPANGTASNNPATDRIGVMPDLKAIIDGNILNLAPDLYLRDFVGDTGDPHSGAISASPDVILSQAVVVNPQAAFGEGSGTENSATLGSQADNTTDNYIYVRVRNRGGSAVTNVQATVYWAPVSTLVTPDLWHLIGTTNIPNVPTGNLLTVSDPLHWPMGDIPGSGHYCFVALIGHAQDPAPIPTDFLNWNDFQQFIRVNNNVTWRNFNVIGNAAPPAADPPDYVALPFLATGAPDRARRMRLEVVGGLPKGAEVLLEVKPEYVRLLKAHPVQIKREKIHRAAYVPLKPWGRTTFTDIIFPAKARIPMRLLVQLPKELRMHEYEIYVRQLYEKTEVGRVTWRLVPPKRLD